MHKHMHRSEGSWVVYGIGNIRQHFIIQHTRIFCFYNILSYNIHAYYVCIIFYHTTHVYSVCITFYQTTYMHIMFVLHFIIQHTCIFCLFNILTYNTHAYPVCMTFDILCMGHFTVPVPPFLKQHTI